MAGCLGRTGIAGVQKKSAAGKITAQRDGKLYNRIILVFHDAHDDLRYLETVAGRLALLFHHQAERAFVL